MGLLKSPARQLEFLNAASTASRLENAHVSPDAAAVYRSTIFNMGTGLLSRQMGNGAVALNVQFGHL